MKNNGIFILIDPLFYVSLGKERVKERTLCNLKKKKTFAAFALNVVI